MPDKAILSDMHTTQPSVFHVWGASVKFLSKTEQLLFLWPAPKNRTQDMTHNTDLHMLPQQRNHLDMARFVGWRVPRFPEKGHQPHRIHTSSNWIYASETHKNVVNPCKPNPSKNMWPISYPWQVMASHWGCFFSVTFLHHWPGQPCLVPPSGPATATAGTGQCKLLPDALREASCYVCVCTYHSRLI